MILRSVFQEGLDLNNNPVYQDFVKYHADAAFWAMVRQGCGFVEEEPDLGQLAIHLLLTAATRTMRQEYLAGLDSFISIPHQAYCYDFISEWLHSDNIRIFLGHVNSMYMSALGNVTSPMWTTMSFCFSIVTGASILISQSVGAGDTEHIEEYSGAMVKYNNIIPILLFFFWTFCAEFVFRLMGVSDGLMPMCLDYSRYYAPVFLITGLGGAFSVILQTSNYTKPLVVYGILRSGVNILLDWVMIFGRFGFPAMGIKGAAIATTIAEYSGLIFAVIFVVSSKKLTLNHL